MRLTFEVNANTRPDVLKEAAKVAEGFFLDEPFNITDVTVDQDECETTAAGWIRSRDFKASVTVESVTTL